MASDLINMAQGGHVLAYHDGVHYVIVVVFQRIHRSLPGNVGLGHNQFNILGLNSGLVHSLVVVLVSLRNGWLGGSGSSTLKKIRFIIIQESKCILLPLDLAQASFLDAFAAHGVSKMPTFGALVFFLS